MKIKLIKGINADTQHKTIVFGKLDGFDNKQVKKLLKEKKMKNKKIIEYQML